MIAGRILYFGLIRDLDGALDGFRWCDQSASRTRLVVWGLEGKLESWVLFDCQFYIKLKIRIDLCFWFVSEYCHWLCVSQIATETLNKTGWNLLSQFLNPHLKVKNYVDVLHFFPIIPIQCKTYNQLIFVIVDTDSAKTCHPAHTWTHNVAEFFTCL